MFRLLRLMLGLSIRAFRSRSDHLTGNLVVRQQLSVAQEATARAETACHRQFVLGRGSKVLVWVEAVADPGKPGDRHRLASTRLPTLQDLEKSPSRRPC